MSKAALDAGIKAWKMVPKFHLFQHLGEVQEQRFGNPSQWWVYADEDYVGDSIEIAKSCHPSTLAETSIFKFVLFHFTDVEED